MPYYTQIPVPKTKAEIEAHEKYKQERAIKKDINKINESLSNSDVTEMTALHRELDGKYQCAINDWGKGMYGFAKDYGFNYEFVGKESLRSNLSLMKSKLEGLILGLNTRGVAVSHTKVPDVNVTVNNTVNITVSFDEARQKIEDMTALSREQTDEILEKIDELEKISKENSSRKTKWEKVKPIISFALEKGADVAIAILSLVMQMKLGM